MIHEPSGDAVFQERHDQLDCTGRAISGVWHIDRIEDAEEIGLFAVGRRHEKIQLVDVEYVMLAGDIANRPFLDIADLGDGVVAIGGPLLAINVKRIAVV